VPARPAAAHGRGGFAAYDERDELAFFRAALDASADAVFIVDARALTFLYANPAACRLRSCTLEQLLQTKPWEAQHVSREQLEREYQDLLAAPGATQQREFLGTDQAGRRAWLELHRHAVHAGEQRWIVASVRNVTARKTAEIAAEVHRRLYVILSETNEAILRTGSAEDLYQRVCDIVVDSGGALTAAVMLPDACGERMHVAATSGPLGAPLRRVQICLDDRRAEGRGLVGAAYRQGRTQVSADHLHDERTAPWHEQAEQAGVRSSAAVPLLCDGRAFGVLLMYSAELDAFDGEAVALLERMGRNISFALANLQRAAERVQAEAALRDSEARFRALTELSSDWYWEHDPEQVFTRIEGRHNHSAGIRQALVGRRPADVGMDFDTPETRLAFSATLAARRAFRDVVMFRQIGDVRRYFAVSGEPLFDAECRFTGYRGVSRDITRQQLAEKRIQHLATHDGLTDLPNGVLVRDRIQQSLAHAARSGTKVALLFLDLDRFKFINDGYGHHFGDAVLREAAARLARLVRDGDTVARLGGDEFLILLADLRKRGDAYLVAQKVLEGFRRPFLIDQREVFVTASIGVSLSPQDGTTVDALIGNADIAMYRSKEHGRDALQFFTAELSEETRQRVQLEAQLRLALEREQLSLVYQPKINVADGRVFGCEALLRWNHPELGAIAPSRFIPIAEETGLIMPIGDWVLRTAARQCRAWREAGLPAVKVSVNISARQFRQQNIAKWVRRVLDETGVDAQSIALELTESMLAEDTEKTVAAVNELKRMGLMLAIDDFGTGFSSLGYLKRFRVDVLKIDQSFIQNMLTEPDDATIVQAIVALGHSLRMKVVAEGVETAEQCALLRASGCDGMQGYYFSRPVPPQELGRMLVSSSWWSVVG
jgi:diguanylate cyclase (GGDEF)-like protein/PAS domain S-box-containing protein